MMTLRAREVSTCGATMRNYAAMPAFAAYFHAASPPSIDTTAAVRYIRHGAADAACADCRGARFRLTLRLLTTRLLIHTTYMRTERFACFRYTC